VSSVESYFASVAAKLRGSGSARLNAELRDHVEDAVAHQVALGHDRADAARITLERLGSPDELLVAWKLRDRARRVQTRRRAGLATLAAATASALAVVQLASGHRPPRNPCPEHTTKAPCGPTSSPTGVTRAES
jgi:hypothetical protein